MKDEDDGPNQESGRIGFGKASFGFCVNGINLVAQNNGGLDHHWKISPKNGASQEQFDQAICIVGNTISEMAPHINKPVKTDQRCAEINFPGWMPHRVRTLLSNNVK